MRIVEVRRACVIGPAKAKKAEHRGGGWDYNTKGERIGKCGDSKKGEGKPMLS